MNRNIPITKPYFDENELIRLQECLDSGWVTQGPMTEQFEAQFSKRQECKYSVAVSSCTAALHLSMLALDIQMGDEVIVPAFTWITTAHCAEYVGAKVIFVDVEKETFNIDPSQIERAITSKTKAIIVVHLFGLSAKMDEILKIARKYNLYVIEDCACAIGTTYKRKPVGSLGDIGCFSFHPRKAITTGEGGMCTTSNKEIAEKLRQLRNHGAAIDKESNMYGKPYYMGRFNLLGFNLRLSDIQACIGISQMEKLEFLLERRLKCAQYYMQLLQGNANYVLPADNGAICGHTYQSFVVLDKNGTKHRNDIMHKMKENNIQTRPGTLAVHRTEYYKDKYKINKDNFPVALACEDDSITLPIFWDMTKDEQQKVVRILLE